MFKMEKVSNETTAKTRARVAKKSGKVSEGQKASNGNSILPPTLDQVQEWIAKDVKANINFLGMLNENQDILRETVSKLYDRVVLGIDAKTREDAD